MINIKSIALSVAIAAFFVSVGYGQYQRVAKEKLEVKAQHYKDEAGHYRNSEIAIRNQYDVINTALADREDKRIAAEKQVTELKEELKHAQKDNKCAREPVPDAVTDRLRARVTKVNATAARAKNAVPPVPGS
ncbi:hypothetical protein SOASR032_24140 [Pragia fontium]|uniref:Uncharacterized protein n=1 Tax=Pragia fontium TaxID=82985 RepID=A0ABQ5LJQ2_9GAMM|nr:hypothetical protein [Pragia fontium]GKX63845.1 hypothetical protein SOASR032_24140 [Pragia fontium]